MSRTGAKKRFTVEDHILATEGVECRKDAEVIDETPADYKPTHLDVALALSGLFIDPGIPAHHRKGKT